MEKSKKAGIFIVDDHPVVRIGLKLLINDQPDLEVCGEAGDANSALETIESAAPDMAIIDLSLKGVSSIELIKKLKERSVRMLVLSLYDEAVYAERALRAGAMGYLMKGEESEKVLEAIRRILDNKIYLSDQMSSMMLGRLQEGGKGVDNLLDRLSDRELEIFAMVGHGRQTRQIAQDLGLSVKTVEAHRAHIMKKLNLEKASELLQYAIRWVQDKE